MDHKATAMWHPTDDMRKPIFLQLFQEKMKARGEALVRRVGRPSCLNNLMSRVVSTGIICMIVVAMSHLKAIGTQQKQRQLGRPGVASTFKTK